MGCFTSTPQKQTEVLGGTTTNAQNEDASKPQQIKVLMVGEFGVGKSSILVRYTKNTFTESDKGPTLTAEFESKAMTVDGQQVELNVWDTAGQERLKTITSGNYNHCRIIGLVFSLADKTSFTALQNWAREAERYGPQNVIVVVIGNKTDLEKERQITKEEGQAFVAECKLFDYFETSAKNGTGMDGFMRAIKESLVRIKKQKEEQDADMLE